MTEIDLTVQVPVSLPTREQIAEALFRVDHGPDARWERTQQAHAEYLTYADAVIALFSQSTTAAEKDRVVITRNQIENGVREVIEDGEWSDADDLPPLIVNAILFRSCYLPAAPRCDGTPECQAVKYDAVCWKHRAIEPSRIEDMAPGREDDVHDEARE